LLSRRGCLLAGLAWPGVLRAQVLPEVPLALGQFANMAFAGPLLELLAQGAGLRWRLLPLPFGRVVAMVERGQALGFGLGRTPAREEILDFSKALFVSRVWPVSRRDLGLNLRGPEDLRGLKVCMGRTVSYGAALDAAKGRHFQVEYSDGDPAARLRMLMAGRCDVLLTAHRSADAWLLERRLRQAGGYSAALMVGPQALVTDPVHIAAAKGSEWAAYLQRIDAALAKAREQIRELVDSAL